MKTTDEWRQYRNGARQYTPDGPIYLPAWDHTTGTMPDVTELPEFDTPAQVVPFPTQQQDDKPLTRPEARTYWD